jgi:RNA polymerase sigma-32 factor
MNRRLSGSDMSLNSPKSEGENSSELIDFLPETRPSHETVMANRQDHRVKHQVLMKAMKILSERELSIIQARKLKEDPLTLDDLSQKFNISKERVRQIENRAFEKLQEYVLSEMACQA